MCSKPVALHTVSGTHLTIPHPPHTYTATHQINLVPRSHPACISLPVSLCAILKAIRTGIGLGSGTKTGTKCILHTSPPPPHTHTQICSLVSRHVSVPSQRTTLWLCCLSQSGSVCWWLPATHLQWNVFVGDWWKISCLCHVWMANYMCGR